MNNLSLKKPIGTFIFLHFPNKGKQKTILSILIEYRKTASIIAQEQWKYFFKYRRFNKYSKIKHISSLLSERYKQTCQWQVVGVLESFISNVKNRFKEYIYNSSLSKEDKIVLLYINKYNLWFNKDIIGKELKDTIISEYSLRIANSIFKHILNTWRKPSFKNISMHLDQKVAILLSKEQNKAKSFDYWINLSTLEKGRPIYIPFKKNPYAESLEGKWLNFVQITLEDESNILIKLVKELKRIEYTPETDKIALDLGLIPLFATDKGDLFGRRFLEDLKKWDLRILKRLRLIQKRRLKPSKDKKYRMLINKFREFLKNEINRVLNNIINIYKPAEIIIEHLDFRSPKLSKRLNRIIQNFGKGIIKAKLLRLQEIFGIKITEINPTYTSQECSSCGYIDHSNRKDTQTFKCKTCGLKSNAQVNGAKNILQRSSLGNLIKIHLPKKEILEILITRYLERHKGYYSASRELCSRTLGSGKNYRKLKQQLMRGNYGEL